MRKFLLICGLVLIALAGIVGLTTGKLSYAFPGVASTPALAGSPSPIPSGQGVSGQPTIALTKTGL